MSARYSPCPLWLAPPPDAALGVADAVARGVERAGGSSRIWFRADDVAQPGRLFTGMLAAFRRHGVPLALAVVPAWLPPRAAELQRLTDEAAELWTLHMHGYRHANHEPTGRKLEFGPARPAAAKRRDLEAGLALLRRHLGERIHPLFTPPWNRCDAETLAALRELGFTAVSRTPGAKPPAPQGLPDLPVRVDLHTRRESDPQISLDGLLTELEDGLATGLCGVMLHHQRANEASAAFLDALLRVVAERTGNGIAAARMQDAASDLADTADGA